MNVDSKQKCATVCENTPNCTWFSYNQADRLCFAMESCSPDYDDQTIFSAPILAPFSVCKCGINAHCDKGYLVEFTNISSPLDCLQECHNSVEHNCNWITYNVQTISCYLFNECAYGFNVSYPYSISAHKSCDTQSLPEAKGMNFLRSLGLPNSGLD